MCGNRRRLKKVDQTNPITHKPSLRFQNHPMDKKINGDVMRYMEQKIETLKEKLAQQLQDSQAGESPEMDTIGEDGSETIGEDGSETIGEDGSETIGENGSDKLEQKTHTLRLLRRRV